MVKKKSIPKKLEVSSTATSQQTIDGQQLLLSSGNDQDESQEGEDNNVMMQENHESIHQTPSSKVNNNDYTMTNGRKIIVENETSLDISEKSVKRRKIIYDDDELIITDMNEFEETLVDEVEISFVPNETTILRINNIKNSGNQETTTSSSCISQKEYQVLPPKHNLMTQLSSNLDMKIYHPVNDDTEIQSNTIIPIRTGKGLKHLLLLFTSTKECPYDDERNGSWYINVAQALETYNFIQAFLLTGEQARLQIYITEKVWTTFSPTSFTTFSKVSFGTSSNKGLELIWALQKMYGELFPNTIVSDIVHKIITIPSREIINPPEVTLNAKTIYNVVDNIHDITKQYENQTIPGLRPKLRQYQKAAVDWMLHREGCHNQQQQQQVVVEENKFHGWELAWVVIDYKNIDSITSNDDKNKFQYCLPLFEWKLKNNNNCKTDKAILYNPFNGWVVSTYQDAELYTLNHHKLAVNQSKQTEDSMILSPSNLNISGGILADSMGLGKTVEVLACILSNPCPKNKWDHKYNTLQQIHKSDTPINNGTLPTLLSNIDYHDMSNYVCICGGSRTNCHSLSWLICNKCHEPIHGRCAGFQSEKEIKQSCDTISLQKKPKVSAVDYRRCPSCVGSLCSQKFIIKSRATLIVTPASILHQWEREIQRHTFDSSSTSKSDDASVPKPLKVLVYPGVHSICSGYNACARISTDYSNDVEEPFQLLHPLKLADADIVLVSFQSLMKELGHSIDNPYVNGDSSQTGSSRKTLRSRKKYRVAPSPLNCIRWWRVCLDEAQRIESPVAASAKMALKLHSIHRWCVSGTPIGRGKLEDIFGLLVFLGVKPFDNKIWFRDCFDVSNRGVLDRIKCLLSDIFWRSTKANPAVTKQMGIPEQIEKKVFLRFSSIERHFYNNHLEDALVAANPVISKNRKQLRKKEAEQLSVRLHTLRAACCHPQVGISGIQRIYVKKSKQKATTPISSTSRKPDSQEILSMDQILDRLIDDARVKAEEAQRLTTMHGNAIASLTNLKAEAKKLGLITSKTEHIMLLQKSINLYLETLDIVNRNTVPSRIFGEAVMKGDSSFQSSNQKVRNGICKLAWQVPNTKKEDVHDTDQICWASFNFEGNAKRISEIHVRHIMPVSIDCEHNNKHSKILYPKDCVFQVPIAALSGTFVDVLSFSLDKSASKTNTGDVSESEWRTFNDLLTSRSKSWRVVIKSCHDQDEESGTTSILSSLDESSTAISYIGLEVQLMEPNILSDNLQRIHVLHNASMVSSRISSNKEDSIVVNSMTNECEKLQDIYVGTAKALHKAGRKKLDKRKEKRLSAREQLKDANEKFQYNVPERVRGRGCDGGLYWWDDFLAWCKIKKDDDLNESICDHIERSLFELFDDPSSRNHRRTFPRFKDINGLQMALTLRLQDVSDNVRLRIPKCLDKVYELSCDPTLGEIYENSHCRECRKDWYQTGPTCRFCKLEKELNTYQRGFRQDGLSEPELMPEQEIKCVIRSLAKWIRDNKEDDDSDSGEDNPVEQGILSQINKRSKLYYKYITAAKNELNAAKVLWKAHINLLSNIDELSQCKRSMRLISIDDKLSDLSEEEKSFIVQACDIKSLLTHHTLEHAGAKSSLTQCLATLRYLKNLSIERQNQSQLQLPTSKTTTTDDMNDTVETCIICLCSLEGERAVLSCGHSFHHSPCVKSMLRKSPIITCPYRCAVKTHKDNIFIAREYNYKRDDGSPTNRHIEGSWGTKVDRLVSDILEARDNGGERSIVFSQWDDMLDIIEHALEMNKITYIRAKGGQNTVGPSVKQFRSDNHISVLTMNIRNGAEGLTLVEANHIFLLEPLLNHGLDSQAINRIHRIGQTSKTYVHRYIIEDTIEIKIDKLRMERQENPIEDSIINNGKKKNADAISAGGMDGSFSQNELRDLLA